jgi:EAL domain-containing protein (putative c-di-GMP-specific phosphodiesterase class I)
MPNPIGVVRFQPIVSSRNGEVCGWEPLPGDDDDGSPAPRWVSDPAAGRRPGTAEDGTWSGRAAVEAASQRLVTDERLLHLAATPDEFWTGLEPDAGFGRLLAALGLRTSQVVLELPDSAFRTEPRRTDAAADEWRSLGYRIGVAGLSFTGAAWSAMERLRPDFARFDPHLCRELDRSSMKFDLAEGLVRHCHRLGARCIAAGVAHQGELDALVSLDVDLLQGPHLSPALAQPAPRAALSATRTVVAARAYRLFSNSTWS